MWRDSGLIGRISSRLSTSKIEAAWAIDIVKRKRPWIGLVSAFAGFATFWGWMYFVWRGIPAICGREVYGWLEKSGFWQTVAHIAMGCGVAILLCVIVASAMNRWLIYRAVAKLPRVPGGRLLVCDSCLYPIPEPPAGEPPRCPECGREAPRLEELETL